MRARVGPLVVDLDVCADALTSAAALAYALLPSLPSVYRARLTYRPPGDLADVLTMLERGHGGCLSIAAARAGELLARGIPARVAVIPARRGLHAIVSTPAGIEDPSRMVHS